ncbi:DUF2254 domain-containing protein [Angustibacter luteus]|uniref:DUF2254 domain-containing protein n=1 Tax=Angustibacter luteus TaxID=658456 RepID=A0ABW1JGB5_9ACTN
MRQTGTGDYLKGALWVYPTAAVLLALVTGSVLSSITIPDGSPLEPLVFKGTAADARVMLIGISGTMMTVIALVLGLTLVALQLSSTQFSPRILRTFLRDRVNQVVLSVFVATFVYSTAGLYTVGVGRGATTDDYPRLAVTLAIALLVASMVVLVYFVHHISHAIQIDQVMVGVETKTMRVIEHDLPTEGVRDHDLPEPPPWAVPVPAYRSGYVQTLQPAPLLRAARLHDLTASVVPMVGEHVLAGEPMVWLWRVTAGDAAPDVAAVQDAVHECVRIGFERTTEQDVAFGMRQLADISVKALSPAINDPYTAIQSLEHISVVLATLAARPLGSQVLGDDGRDRVVLHGRDLEYYVELATGQIRRYGRDEPRVLQALLRTLHRAGYFCRDDAGRDVVARHVRLVIEAARDGVVQATDLAPVVAHGEAVLREVTR